jgi:hypothetical protein
VDEEQVKIRMLGNAIGCGDGLARDLLLLAGNDYDLVREASVHCTGIESVKTYIINKRFMQIEEMKESE